MPQMTMVRLYGEYANSPYRVHPIGFLPDVYILPSQLHCLKAVFGNTYQEHQVPSTLCQVDHLPVLQIKKQAQEIKKWIQVHVATM